VEGVSAALEPCARDARVRHSRSFLTIAIASVYQFDRLRRHPAGGSNKRSEPSKRSVGCTALRARLPRTWWCFQGDDDENTPARFVGELADWNTATGHLDLEVSYYRGAHAGSPEARRQLADLIVHAIERASLDHR
jgi:hypothetical protein